MPKVTAVTTNFTSGELTPKMGVRIDVQRYQNGAALIENGWPIIHGGIDKRWGTLYRGATKVANKKARLIPFVFSRSQAYWLEFGEGYMRVHTPAGQVLASPGVPYEIATPYTEAQVQAMDFNQGADTMILWHTEVHPRRLRRFADNRWVLDMAPFNPVPFDEIGVRLPVAVTLSATTVGTARTATAASATWLAADLGREIYAGAGTAKITAITSPTVVTVDVTSAFEDAVLTSGAWSLAQSPQTGCTASAATPVGDAITLTLDADGWRSMDVGQYVVINGGLVKITAVTSALIANGRIERELSSATKAVAGSWTLNFPAWNDQDGYPSTGTFHSQRLLAAGSPAYPQTIWGSPIGDYFSFLLGTLDTDAFAFQMVSDDLNPITYLSSMEALVALSFGGEFTMDGGVEKPITPTNVRAKPRSNHGCAQVRPARVGSEEVYVQRTGKRIRAASYNEISGAWAAPDISVLADHIISPGITALSWHKEPSTLVMAARADGILAHCTFDRDQDVAGWARSDLGGVVESIATVPDGDRDRTMLIVRREINGATVRYVELFDQDAYTDSAAKGQQLTPDTVWTGFDHLEGKEVAILADGVSQPRQTVTGGQVTLQRPATSVEVGLPIKMRIKLLPPEVTGGAGAALGSQQRANQVAVVVRDTVGLQINGQEVSFRQLGVGILDQPLAPFTGFKDVTDLGWDTGTVETLIEHDHPLPCHVMGVIRKFTFNET
jgi:hypothetical protein